MTLWWRYADLDGAAVPGPEITFDDQTGAEEWLTGQWPDLLDSGVEQVTLCAGTAEIYGPMSLRPE